MTSRRNIVFIMSDHTNAAALAPGSQCQTPNLDRLASEGRRFAHCHTTNAICSPARASLMTGTYPSTHGMWDCTHTQRREWVNVSLKLNHWADSLQRAGWKTGYFGKWHVEQTNKLDDFGWAEYDRSGSLKLQEMPDSEVRIPKAGYRDYILAAAGRDDGVIPAHPAYEKGIDFLRRQKDEEAPFCCFVSTTEPHDPYVPPKTFLDQYNLNDIKLSDTLQDECAGKPEVIRRMRSVWSGLSEEDWKVTTAAYWATISYLDYEIGRVVETLQEIGKYDDTIIVFTSDHGDMLGSHGLITKGVGTSYEEVYTIPLIIRAPGFPAAEDSETHTSLVDVGPTLLDLAGLEIPANYQGKSLVPVLQGAADKSDWVDGYAEFFGQRFVYTQRIVWHENWKYTFSPGGIDELYNLDADPGETNNLAEDPAHRKTLEDMCRRMWRKMRDIGDDSLFNTNYATLRTAPIGPGCLDEES